MDWFLETSAQVVSINAPPDLFRPGDTVDVSLVLSNTGTLSLSGEAVIQVQVAGGVTTTAIFTHTVSGLAPGAERTFNDAWDTTGATAADLPAPDSAGVTKKFLV